MDERIPLTWQGREWGVIRCRDEEVRTAFSLRCVCPGSGVYKVWLIGEAGRMLLGTPMPEGNALVLRRTLSHSALAQEGVSCPVEGQLLPAREQPSRAEGGWTAASGQAVEAEDRVLRRCLGKIPRLWLRRRGDTLEAAVPWRPGEPVPVTPLFCLAAPGQVGDVPCLTFCFQNGRPVPPHNWEEPGKD